MNIPLNRMAELFDMGLHPDPVVPKPVPKVPLPPVVLTPEQKAAVDEQMEWGAAHRE